MVENYTNDLKTVWDENIWITTRYPYQLIGPIYAIWLTVRSGYFSLAPLSCVLKVCKIDKIMYSVDYPFCRNDNGLAFVKEMQGSDMLSDEDLNAICYKNAESLLRVKAKV